MGSFLNISNWSIRHAHCKIKEPLMIPFSSPEPTILLACGRNRELWEQPFWNNKGNNRTVLPIRFNAVCIYGACLKWLLPELSYPAAGQKNRRLWGRECDDPWSKANLKWKRWQWETLSLLLAYSCRFMSISSRFARCRHLTTTTRIPFDFSLLFKFWSPWGV